MPNPPMPLQILDRDVPCVTLMSFPSDTDVTRVFRLEWRNLGEYEYWLDLVAPDILYRTPNDYRMPNCVVTTFSSKGEVITEHLRLSPVRLNWWLRQADLLSHTGTAGRPTQRALEATTTRQRRTKHPRPRV